MTFGTGMTHFHIQADRIAFVFVAGAIQAFRIQFTSFQRLRFTTVKVATRWFYVDYGHFLRT